MVPREIVLKFIVIFFEGEIIMKKRYIFDLDGTLMRGDFRNFTDQYLLEQLGEEARPVVGHIHDYLSQYERTFPRYTDENLSRFLREQTGVPFTPELIREWDELVVELPNTLEEGVLETLEELIYQQTKQKNCCPI